MTVFGKDCQGLAASVYFVLWKASLPQLASGMANPCLLLLPKDCQRSQREVHAVTSFFLSPNWEKLSHTGVMS